MRPVIVVVLTTIATCALLVFVVSTCSNNVNNPPDWLKVVGWLTLVGSPLIGIAAGILVLRAIRRSDP